MFGGRATDPCTQTPGRQELELEGPQQIRQVAELLGVALPDTRDETLALYAKEHDFISALRDYRKASKLASTYGAGWRTGTTRTGAFTHPGASYGQPPGGWPATTLTCRTSPEAVPLEATSVRPKAASSSSRTTRR